MTDSTRSSFPAALPLLALILALGLLAAPPGVAAQSSAWWNGDWQR